MPDRAYGVAKWTDGYLTFEIDKRDNLSVKQHLLCEQTCNV